jgi:hypothetical protein
MGEKVKHGEEIKIIKINNGGIRKAFNRVGKFLINKIFMKKYFKQHANISSGEVMEARDHFKNGASPKSLTSRGKRFIMRKVNLLNLILLLVLFGTIVSCDRDVTEESFVTPEPVA